MSEETKHINYSAADIEKYYRGELSAADMHAMEKAALDDPFLSDAMEGYEVSGVQQPQPPINDDINDLKNRLATRIAGENKKTPVIKFAWWKVAAAVLVFIGAGWMYTSINNKSKQVNIAKVKEVNNPTPLPAPAITDSTKTSFNADTVIVAGDLAATDKKPTIRNIAPVYKRREITTDSFSVAANQAPIEKEELEKSAGKPGEEFKKDLIKTFDKQDTVAGKPIAAKSEDSQGFLANTDKKQKFAPELYKKVPDVSANTNETFYNPLAGRANNLSNTFNGKIVDASDRPLANATVQIPNLNIATVTNEKGYFSFKAPDTALKVSVASAGFETQNLELTTNNIDNERNVIRLKPSLINLNEVVVTGYGTKKKAVLAKTNDVTIKIMNAAPSVSWSEYNQYLEKNKKIPGEMKDIHGEVVVSFVVGSKGALKNFNIEKSLIEQLDNEAVRLVKQGPSWKLLKGKKAKVSVTVKF